MERDCVADSGADRGAAYGIGCSCMVDDQSDVCYWQTVGQYAAEPPAWTRLYESNLHKDTDMGLTLNDLLDSKFLKKEDLGDDEHVVTIRKVSKTNTAREDQEPKYKAAIKFDEFAKPMIANKTNLKRIAAALGDDIELWTGKQVTLFYDPD